MGEHGDQADNSPEFATTAGQLLVSVPNMGDDNFDRTVVFVVEHNESGALGLVLNRPSETEVGDHLEHLVASVVSPTVFFIGGPVAVGGLMALGRRRLESELTNAVSICGPIVMADPEALIAGRVGGVEALRLFTGYSGWGPGQLDGEITVGAWHVCESMVDDVLCVEPNRLWRSVMKRQGGKFASQSLFPEDLSVN